MRTEEEEWEIQCLYASTLHSWVRERGWVLFEVSHVDYELWVPARDYLYASWKVDHYRPAGTRCFIMLDQL